MAIFGDKFLKDLAYLGGILVNLLVDEVQVLRAQQICFVH